MELSVATKILVIKVKQDYLVNDTYYHPSKFQ